MMMRLLRPWPLWLALALPALAPADDSLAGLRQDRRWTELRLEARAALAQSPRNPEAHAALVEALWRGGDVASALAAAATARQQGADSPALRQSEATALALLERWPEVTRALGRDVEADAAPAETLLLAGRALREQGHTDAARALLRRLLQREPGNTPARLELARVELAARRPAEALARLREIPPATAGDDVLLLTARAQADTGQPRDAVATLTRALEQAPMRASLYALRARQLANLQAWPEAARDIHSALLLGARAAEDYLLACEAARMLDDTEALAGYARAGMDLHPQRAEFALQLARALRGLGAPAKARELLSLRQKDFPGNTALILELALAQAAEGRQQEVVATLDPLLASQPSAQGYALRAYARLRLGALARAEEDAGNALVLEPGLPTALLVQARVALARGEPARAEPACRQALARAPALAWAHTTCGEVALALGKLDTARTLAEEALALSPQDAEALQLKARLTGKGARP